MNSEELQKAYVQERDPTKDELSEYHKTVMALRFQKLEEAADRLGRNSFELVREFMEKFGHPVKEKPQNIENLEWEWMRLGLILEEVCELFEACGYDPVQLREAVIPKVAAADIVKTADALGDIEYVVNGMAHGTGVNLPAVVREIHRSNMTKLGPDGKPIYREDGKILKGKDYEPPNLEAVLGL